MRPLPEGSPAPLFEAPMSAGGVMRLSDYHGKKNVVLFFFPKDFTPGCTRQVCLFRDFSAVFEKLDAAIFGISYDSISTHERFVGRYNLPFTLLTDVDRSISRSYGVARLNGLLALVKRVTFVIDKEGVIRGVVHQEADIDRHIDEVLAAVRDLPPG